MQCRCEVEPGVLALSAVWPFAIIYQAALPVSTQPRDLFSFTALETGRWFRNVEGSPGQFADNKNQIVKLEIQMGRKSCGKELFQDYAPALDNTWLHHL